MLLMEILKNPQNGAPGVKYQIARTLLMRCKIQMSIEVVARSTYDPHHGCPIAHSEPLDKPL